jgi:hypothetical protein
VKTYTESDLQAVLWGGFLIGVVFTLAVQGVCRVLFWLIDCVQEANTKRLEKQGKHQ